MALTEEQEAKLNALVAHVAGLESKAGEVKKALQRIEGKLAYIQDVLTRAGKQGVTF